MQTSEFTAALQTLIDLAGTARIAAMCAEAVPWRCHRSLIADALTVRGVAVERVNAALSPIERVRRFVVARAPFDIDNGMLTPSMKIRRHKIKAVYGEALEALYEKPAAQPADPGSAEARAPARP